MALIAYMPTAACAVPGEAGRLPEAAGEPIFFDRAGLEVGAGQLVYGERPVAGVKAGVAAARRGAGCLVAKVYETDPGPPP